MIAAAGTTGARCPGVGPRSGPDSRIRREDSPLISTAIRAGHNRLDERSSRSRSVTSVHIVISSNNYSSPCRIGLRGWMILGTVRGAQNARFCMAETNYCGLERYREKRSALRLPIMIHLPGDSFGNADFRSSDAAGPADST